MPKRAFLVLGAESSGTRVFTRLLIDAGCRGDGNHEQGFDVDFPTEDLIVWRRSVPHHGQMPPIAEMIGALQKNDYEVIVLVLVRNFIANMASQINNFFSSTEAEALEKIKNAFIWIWSEIGKSNVHTVQITFESLTEIGFVSSFLRHFGLNEKALFEELNFENLKHYICDK